MLSNKEKLATLNVAIDEIYARAVAGVRADLVKLQQGCKTIDQAAQEIVWGVDAVITGCDDLDELRAESLRVERLIKAEEDAKLDWQIKRLENFPADTPALRMETINPATGLTFPLGTLPDATRHLLQICIVQRVGIDSLDPGEYQEAVNEAMLDGLPRALPPWPPQPCHPGQ